MKNSCGIAEIFLTVFVHVYCNYLGKCVVFIYDDCTHTSVTYICTFISQNNRQKL